MSAQPGDWSCHRHGVISPDTAGCVPSCPVCGAMAMQVHQHRSGEYLVHVQPWPEHCAGAGRHPFGPGRATVSFRGCGCPPTVRAGARGHTVWWCGVCLDQQVWPPHEGA